MHSNQRQALLDLLETYRLPRAYGDDRDVLHSTGPALDETENTYVRANELLSDELRQGELKQCIHVTGVFKALSDPFHRRICRLASRRGREFFVAGYVPHDAILSGAGMMNWLRTKWVASWTDRLSAFSLVAKEQAEVARLPDFAPLHFSLFNYRYVLLQTENRDAHTKFVWLLDNPTLNNALSDTAAKHQQTAEPLDSSLFRKELLALCSPSSRELLWRLQEEGELDPARFDVELLSSLAAAGLVDKSVSVQITTEGRAFLKAW